MPLPAGEGENGFLDLGDGEIPDLFQLDVRHVRHLVGGRGNVDGNLEPADDFSELDLRRPHARSPPVNLTWSTAASEIEIPGYPAPVDPVPVKMRPVDR